MHTDLSRAGQLNEPDAQCSPEWRLARSWSASEIEDRLASLSHCPLSTLESAAATESHPSFRHYYSESQIFGAGSISSSSAEAFERACAFLANYEFSDPRIVVGHFDRRRPLLGRRMLLELKAFRVFHYLCGVEVRAIRNEAHATGHVFGFRYDTLVGHIETGSEWFLLTRDAKTNKIKFRIQAAWKPGHFPNWWSRLGFAAVGRHYQHAWHRLAHARMRQFLSARNVHSLAMRSQPLLAKQITEVESKGKTQ